MHTSSFIRNRKGSRERDPVNHGCHRRRAVASRLDSVRGASATARDPGRHDSPRCPRGSGERSSAAARTVTCPACTVPVRKARRADEAVQSVQTSPESRTCCRAGQQDRCVYCTPAQKMVQEPGPSWYGAKSTVVGLTSDHIGRFPFRRSGFSSFRLLELLEHDYLGKTKGMSVASCFRRTISGSLSSSVF